jgi:hypothetical protein
MDYGIYPSFAPHDERSVAPQTLPISPMAIFDQAANQGLMSSVASTALVKVATFFISLGCFVAAASNSYRYTAKMASS